MEFRIALEWLFDDILQRCENNGNNVVKISHTML